VQAYVLNSIEKTKSAAGWVMEEVLPVRYGLKTIYGAREYITVEGKLEDDVLII
jgi:hypothetical protein